MMKFLTTCLLGLMMIVMFTFLAQSADAQQCFHGQQQLVQPVVAQYGYGQQQLVQQQFVQPQRQFVRQRVIVQPQRQFVRQNVIVQPQFQRSRIVQRQRLVGGVGFGGVSPVRSLSLLGAFGRDAQRFSAFSTGLGF